MADKTNFEKFLEFVKTFDQKGLLELNEEGVIRVLELFGVSEESLSLDSPVFSGEFKSTEKLDLAWKDGNEAHIESVMNLLLLKTLQNLEHYSNAGLLKNLEAHHLDFITLLVSKIGNKRKLSGHNGLFLKILARAKLEHGHTDSLFKLIHALYFAPFAKDVDRGSADRGNVILFSNNELNTLDSVLSKYVDATLASLDSETLKRLASVTKLLLEVSTIYNTNNDKKVITKLLSFTHFCCQKELDGWPKDTIFKYIGLNVNNFFAVLENTLNTTDEQQDWLNSEQFPEVTGNFFGVVRLINDPTLFDNAKPALKTRLLKRVVEILGDEALTPTELLPALTFLSNHLNSLADPSKTRTHSTSWPQQPDEAMENKLIGAIVKWIHTLYSKPSEPKNAQNKGALKLLTDILVRLSNINIEMIERNFNKVFDLVRMDAELHKRDLECLKTIWNTDIDLRGNLFEGFCFKVLTILFDTYNGLRKLFVLFSMVNGVYKYKKANYQETKLHEKQDLEDGVFWIFMSLVRRRFVDGNENMLARLKHERFPQSLFTVVAFCVSRLNLGPEGQNRLLSNDFASMFKNNNILNRTGNPEEKTLIFILSVLIAVRRLLANSDLSLKFAHRPSRDERTDGLLEIVCTLHSWVVRVNEAALKTFNENSEGGPLNLLKSITYHFKMINNEEFYYSPFSTSSEKTHDHKRFCLSLRDLVGADDFKYDPILPVVFENYNLGNPDLRLRELSIIRIKRLGYNLSKALLFKRLNDYSSHKTNIVLSRLELNKLRTLVDRMPCSDCPVITKTILNALDYNLSKFLDTQITQTNILMCQKSVILVALLYWVIAKETGIHAYGALNILIRWKRNLFDVLTAIRNWQTASNALTNWEDNFNYGTLLAYHTSLYFKFFTMYVYSRALDPTLIYSLLHNFVKNSTDASHLTLYNYIKMINGIELKNYKALLGPRFSKYVCGKWMTHEGEIPNDFHKAFIIYNWILINFPGSKPERETIKHLVGLAEILFKDKRLIQYLVVREFVFKSAYGVFEAVLNFWLEPEDCDRDNVLLVLSSVPIVPAPNKKYLETKADNIKALACDLQVRTKAAFDSMQATTTTIEQWTALKRLVVLNYLVVHKFHPFGILGSDIVGNAIQLIFLLARQNFPNPQLGEEYDRTPCDEPNAVLTVLFKVVGQITHSKMPYFYYQFSVIVMQTFAQKTTKCSDQTYLQLLTLAAEFMKTIDKMGKYLAVVLTILVRTWHAIDKSGWRSAELTEGPGSYTKDEVLKKMLKTGTLKLIRDNGNRLKGQFSPEVVRFYKENS